MPPTIPCPIPPELRELAKKRFLGFTTAAHAAHIAAPCMSELPGDVERVWACSEFVTQSCVRDPTLVDDLLGSGHYKLLMSRPNGR